CLVPFHTWATTVARMPVYVGSSEARDYFDTAHAEELLRPLNTNLTYIATIGRHQFGNGDFPAHPIANPDIWAQAVDAYLRTLAAWPRLRNKVPPWALEDMMVPAQD